VGQFEGYGLWLVPKTLRNDLSVNPGGLPDPLYQFKGHYRSAVKGPEVLYRSGAPGVKSQLGYGRRLTFTVVQNIRGPSLRDPQQPISHRKLMTSRLLSSD